MRAMRIVLAGLLLVFLGGCSGSKMAVVSGTVLMDGEPLREGDILFEEVDNNKTPVGGKIVDGKYQVEMEAGSKKVKILASRPTSRPDPVMGAAAREQMIALEFNEKTTLTTEILPGKQTGVNFQVKQLPRLE